MLNVRVNRFWTAPLLCAIALTVFESPATGQSSRAAAPRVPAFKVDPRWPLDTPDKWILGAVTGVFVDPKQHVWVTHLPETLTEEETSVQQKPPIGTCCVAAPPVVEFDAQGKSSRAGDRDRWTIRQTGRATRTASSSITTTSSGSAPTCTIA
jgi:hypothetical protein